MLYPGQYGKSLVSEEFNQMCIDAGVEATVQALPNPNMKSLRVITFRNFNSDTAKVIQSNGTISMIPANGTVQVMLQPDEPLPQVERIL